MPDYLGCETLARIIATQTDTLVLSSTWCLAASIGPVVGGSLAAQGKWRWLFCTCNISKHYLEQGDSYN